MKTLDRYIVRSFVISAVLWLLIFISLRVVVDMFVNLDEFTEKQMSFAKTVGNITSYYSHQTFLYFVQLGGVIIVISAASTLVVMNRSNELTAMLASGVSLYRVVLPMLVCAMFLGGLIILDQELVIPRIAGNLVRSREDIPGTEEFSIRFVSDGTRAVWYCNKFRLSENVMRGPLVPLRDSQFNTLGYIVGGEARPREVDGRSGWAITDAALIRAGVSWRNVPDVRRVFTNKPLQDILHDAARVFGQHVLTDPKVELPRLHIPDSSYDLTIEAKGLVAELPPDGGPRTAKLIQPLFSYRIQEELEEGGKKRAQSRILAQFLADSAVWKPKRTEDDEDDCWALVGGVLFYPTDLTTEDVVLRRSSQWLDYMSSSELARLLRLKRVPDREKAMLVKHVRFTDPINNLIMLLLGVPFILSRERKIKASIAICVLMVGVFFAFVYICRFMDLPPTLAAWLPVLLFGPVAVVMVDSIKT